MHSPTPVSKSCEKQTQSCQLTLYEPSDARLHDMPLSGYVATDDLTVLLGLSAAALFLLQNLYKPQPLVHPILLGRQSDVAPVRNPSESAVYRNYSTSAMGRVSVATLESSGSLTAGA